MPAISTFIIILAQSLKQKLGKVNFYINKNYNLYPVFQISLKDKLAVNEPAIRNKYTQILYLFNNLKNDIATRI